MKMTTPPPEHTRQFCHNCGKLTTHLVNGLCTSCYEQNYDPGSVKADPFTLTVCGSCHAIQTGKNSWTEPLPSNSLHIYLQERLRDNLNLTHKNDHATVLINIEQAFEQNYPIYLPVTYIINHTFQSGDESLSIQRKLQCSLRLEKGICKRCSNIKLGVSHAIVQVRREAGSMSEEDIVTSLDILKHVMRKETRTFSDYVPKIEEKHGGIDFHVSEKHLADEIGQSLIHAFGGKLQTTFKLVGEDKDGKKKYKTTISVRLPLLRVNDHVFYKESILKVISTNYDGISLQSYLEPYHVIHLSWKQASLLQPVDSYLIIKTMLVTAITQDSVILMNLEDNSYEELEVAKSIFPSSLQESSTIYLATYNEHYYYLGNA